MKIPASELIINPDGSAFHIHLLPEDIAGKVVICGDPGRVQMISEFLSDIEFRKQSREFASVTGRYNGERITVLSHGIGTDNIDIVMTELDALANIDFQTREVRPEHRRLTIVRVGTCGAIQPDIPIGSFIFSHISVGCDGMMNWYAGTEDIKIPGMTEAFKEHTHWSKRLPDPYFIKASGKLIKLFEDCTVKGMTVSACGFYGPQGRSVRLPLAMPDMLRDFESFIYNGYRITNFEMESSAVAGMARLQGHDAGTVCCAIANRYAKDSEPSYHDYMRKLVKLVLDRLTSPEPQE